MSKNAGERINRKVDNVEKKEKKKSLTFKTLYWFKSLFIYFFIGYVLQINPVKLLKQNLYFWTKLVEFLYYFCIRVVCTFSGSYPDFAHLSFTMT